MPALRLLRCLPLAALLTGAVAQQPAPDAAPQTAPTLTYHISVQEVLLDVVVIDHAGNPIPGLTAADFSVTEEGAPQTIRSLRWHGPMTPAELARMETIPALPPNTFTNYTPVANTNVATVILLDALDTPIVAQQYLRQELIRCFRHMQPGVPIAIFQLDTEMHLIQGFTSDPRVLLAAAESRRDIPSLSKPIHGDYGQYRRARAEILRDGMKMMGRYLAGFPGRKNLIWFTGEAPMTLRGYGFGDPFHDSFSVAGDDPADDLDNLTAALTTSRVAVYPVDARGLKAPPGFSAARAGRPGFSTTRYFYRQNENDDNLELVARQTGGQAFYNLNDVGSVIAKVTSETSGYYTLAYSTTNTKWQGEYRNITLTVDRPVAQLEYRHGYYALNRDRPVQRALKRRHGKAAVKPVSGGNAAPVGAPTPTVASTPLIPVGALIRQPKQGGFGAVMQLGAVPPTEIVFVASIHPEATVEKIDKHDPMPANNYLAQPWQHKPFRTYDILFNASGRNLELTPTADGRHHGNVDFVAVLYDAHGDIVNTIEDNTKFDFNDALCLRMLEQGLPWMTHIAVPVKGHYFLRLGVHDVTGDAAGAMEVPVDQIRSGAAVPGFPAP
ncbi:MAG TPA: VWA domain-containing protein [Acidobacteriaceae bacterium]|nr:VWA domain-containing protein [Acidobacteriaceae bacterium]